MINSKKSGKISNNFMNHKMLFFKSFDDVINYRKTSAAVMFVFCEIFKFCYEIYLGLKLMSRKTRLNTINELKFFAMNFCELKLCKLSRTFRVEMISIFFMKPWLHWADWTKKLIRSFILLITWWGERVQLMKIDEQRKFSLP